MTRITLWLGWVICLVHVPLALFIWAYIGEGAAHSKTPTLNEKCPGLHYTDFLKEAQKNAMTIEEFEGQYLKQFFVAHTVYAKAPVEIMNLRPETAIVFHSLPTAPLKVVMVAYFDKDACYLVSQKMEPRVLDAIKLQVQKSNV